MACVCEEGGGAMDCNEAAVSPKRREQIPRREVRQDYIAWKLIRDRARTLG